MAAANTYTDGVFADQLNSWQCTPYPSLPRKLFTLDYLVKPISFPRFMQTMQKVGRAQNQDPDEIAETRNSPDEFLLIKADRLKVEIWTMDIVYKESRKEYVRLHTTQGAWFCH